MPKHVPFNTHFITTWYKSGIMNILKPKYVTTMILDTTPLNIEPLNYKEASQYTTWLDSFREECEEFPRIILRN